MSLNKFPFFETKKESFAKKRDTFNFFDLENGILRGERTFIHEMLCNIHKRFVVSSLNKKIFFRWVESLFLTFREDVMKLR